MTAADARARADHLLKSGAPLLAYDDLAESLIAFPEDVRLRQLMALALSRAGASRAAIDILDRLERDGHTDEETLGLRARAHKDIWLRERAAADTREQLRRAHDYYRRAFETSHGFWSGINAATTALALGDRDRSAVLARQVRRQCEELAGTEGDEPDYWLLATLGEAALLLEDQDAAALAYRRAGAAATDRPADLAATRRNARLIAESLGARDLPLQEWLRIPRVAVFAGHLIDAPGRAEPRFPPDLEDAARDAIQSRLKAIDAGFGYASAACGGDILFLECLDRIGAESTIVLPYGSEQFVADSVERAGAGWTARYHRTLERAREVITASEQRMAGGELSYEYAMLLLDGLAGIRADELDTDAVAMALWDGKPGDGRGGTAATVDWWRSTGRHVEIVDLTTLRGAPIHVTTAPATVRPAADGANALEARIVSLLFADARGFSKLTEPQMPAFIEHFLGAAARTLSASSHPPVLRNTWGDGLYFVFEHVADAGRFALDLSAAVNGTDWSVYGLPSDLTLRIGLHAGPAYACIDPITAHPNFLGAHVSRAARIEPITPPGQVYASRAFAALARAHRARGFTCEYVGRASLPKGAGELPLYLVRRRTE